MTLCTHLTQIGRFLVPCGWPADGHASEFDERAAIILMAVGEEPARGLIRDHAFMAPEPVAEVVP